MKNIIKGGKDEKVRRRGGGLLEKGKVLERNSVAGELRGPTVRLPKSV